MILYGRKAKSLGTEAIIGKCGNCGNQNTMQMSIVQTYAHVYWIPMFPTGTEAVTECYHCKQVLREAQFTPQLREEYKEVKARLGRPIWAYTGLMIIGVVIVIGLLVNAFNSRRTASLLDNPKKGDVYEVKLTSDSYTLYRIIDVIGDSVVYFQVNEYETNQKDGLEDLKRKYGDTYMPDTIGFTIKAFQSLHDEGKILGVDRR
jgi:hypothetical protein